jgi:hypothetical protein
MTCRCASYVRRSAVCPLRPLKTLAAAAMPQARTAPTSLRLSRRSPPCARASAGTSSPPKQKSCSASFCARRQCAATQAVSKPSAASLFAFSKAAPPPPLCSPLASSRVQAYMLTSLNPMLRLRLGDAAVLLFLSFAGRALFLQLRSISSFLRLDIMLSSHV